MTAAGIEAVAHRALRIVLLAAVWPGLGGCAEDLTGLDAAQPTEVVQLAEGVSASLFRSPAEVRPGDTLNVLLRLQNRRNGPVELVSAAEPLAWVQTTREGVDVPLVGTGGPSFESVTSYTLAAGEEHVLRWRVVAERAGTPGGAPVPGSYRLLVHLRLLEVAGAQVPAPVTLGGTFLVR